MTIQAAIIDNFNQKLSRVALYRTLMDHADWRGGGWTQTSCERHAADGKNTYAYSFITLERSGSD